MYELHQEFPNDFVPRTKKIKHFQENPWHAWKEKQVSNRPPITTVLTVALENCKKSPLKHFTEKSILLNFDGIMTHFEKMPYFALNVSINMKIIITQLHTGGLILEHAIIY